MRDWTSLASSSSSMGVEYCLPSIYKDSVSAKYLDDLSELDSLEDVVELDEVFRLIFLLAAVEGESLDALVRAASLLLFDAVLE